MTHGPTDTDGPPRRTRAVALGIALVVSAVCFEQVAWWTDDMLITLRVVEQVHDGAGPVWNVGERVQATTHPLWLAIVTLVRTVAPPIASVWITSLACTLAMVAVGWRHLARRYDLAIAALWLALVWTQRTTAHYTTSGLEGPLTQLLLVLAATRVDTRARHAGWLMSALALTRPDAVVVLAPWWLSRVVAGSPAQRAREIASGLAPLAAYAIAATIYYGTPIPNTFLAKVASGPSVAEKRVTYGLEYVTAWLTTDWVAWLGVGLLACGIARPPSRPWRWLAFGALIHVPIVIVLGGDYLLGRLLVPTATLGLLAVAEAFGRREKDPRWTAAAACGVAVVGVALPGTPMQGLVTPPLRPAGTPAAWLYEGPAGDGHTPRPLSSWWDSPCRSTEQEHPPVFVVQGIGHPGFCMPRSTHIVDVYALADPLLSRLPANAGPPGHLQRDLPEGYVDWLEGRTDGLADPDLDAYHRKVRAMTRGPLWTRERWAAIAHLTFVEPTYDPPP